ncbi:MAG: hypothetical protein KDK24_19395 [Pseudooceanicola sp.]|nr:hypothetical protein [Pseudooceanicola sp.]
MELVADILLVAGALGAGLYCFVLARRLNRFNDLEKGVGGAVAVLSAQVDDLTRTLIAAQSTATGSNDVLADLTGRAESVASRLELMMASMHDLPVAAAPPQEEEEPAPEEAVANEPEQVADDAPPARKGVMFMRHDSARRGAA